MRGGYSFVACDYCVFRGAFRCMHPMSMHVSRVASLFRLYDSLPNKASEAIAGLPWPAAGQLSGTPGPRTHLHGFFLGVRPVNAFPTRYIPLKSRSPTPLHYPLLPPSLAAVADG